MYYISVLFQVNQLEQTMKEQNQEMEHRVQKLDANVRKQEVEVQERTKQVLKHIINKKIIITFSLTFTEHVKIK